MIAAGCARDTDKYPQSDGHVISTWRFVAQHTGQMSRLSAGQARRAFRVPQRTHVSFILDVHCHSDIAIWIVTRIITRNSGQFFEVYGLQFHAVGDAAWTIRSWEGRRRPSTSGF